MVSKVAGGMAQILSVILKAVFISLTMHITGQTLDFMSGSVKRLVCRFGFFIQDGGAHKITWHCVGDGGNRFCMLCKNLVTIDSDLADGEGAFRCTVCNLDELDMATNEDIREACRRVHYYKDIDRTAAEFKTRQTQNGFTWHKYNMLMDPELDELIRPADQFMHDWMHCIFVQGVWNLCTNMLLNALEAGGIRDAYPKLFDYTQLWTWPARLKMTRLHELFWESKRTSNRTAGQFKCQASMGLSLYSVLTVWLQTCVRAGICVAEIAAYIALCDIIDYLLCLQRGHGSAEQFLLIVQHFLALHVAAYGEENQTPKFHWLLHLPLELDAFKMLLSCFVHERKHRMLKAYCEDIRNTAAFEKSVLSEAVCHQLMRIDNDSTFNYAIGLLNPHRAAPKLKQFCLEALDLQEHAGIEVMSSSYSKHNPLAYSLKHDVVLLKDGSEFFAGQVVAHVSIDGEFLSLINQYELVDLNREIGLATWKIQSENIMIPTDQIVDPVCWCKYSDDSIRTILPREFL